MPEKTRKARALKGINHMYHSHLVLMCPYRVLARLLGLARSMMGRRSRLGSLKVRNAFLVLVPW